LEHKVCDVLESLEYIKYVTYWRAWSIKSVLDTCCTVLLYRTCGEMVPY
jgi:hypothetical protein